MENSELNLNGGCKDGGEGFMDRSKVRILLCDSDMESSDEVFSLLSECSYQATRVRSARQMIDALNAEGPEIDIILADVDLSITKGMKMLKYITRNKELRRIPVIMMSAKNEVETVVNCLRLGAADYLLKPLRTNELLNLWTHMWRRRHKLGLADKNHLKYDIELIASDLSDANTISSTLFSDDSDDKSQKRTNPEMGVSTHQEDESAAAAVELPQTDPSECHPGTSDCRTGRLLSDDPKKSELKINGGSSAFFSYLKSNAVTNGTQVTDPNDDQNAAKYMIIEENPQFSDQQAINQETWDSFLFMGRSPTPPVPIEFSQEGNFKEDEFSHPRNEPQHHAYPYYATGVLSQVAMPSSSSHLFLNNLPDLRNHASSSAPPQYNHLQQHHSHPHVSGMVASFPYYPVNMMPTAPSLPTVGNSSSGEMKLTKVNRREAALIRFRKKRMERCFDKKIRYANRKSVADRRIRVKGQFASKAHGVTIDLNGQPASEPEDEEDKELASIDSPHEDDIPGS